MRLFIARHGETDWNKEPARCQGWTDISLNEKGRKQAVEIAELAKSENIKKIYSSHLARAKQTAEIISDMLNIPLETDQRLAEAKKGSWEGIPFLNIAEDHQEIWKQWLERPYLAPIPGGETLRDVVIRAAQAIKEILNDNNHDILIISHGGPISALRCVSEGLEFDRIHEMHPDNGQLFKLNLEPFIMLSEHMVSSPFDSLNIIKWS